MLVFALLGGVHRRADGRPDARVPRQEDPGGRDEARRRCTSSPCRSRSSLGTAIAIVTPTVLARLDPQSGTARVLRGALRVHVGRRTTTDRRSPGSTREHHWSCNVARRSAMLIGRFFLIIPALAIAGSLAAQADRVPASRRARFPTDTPALRRPARSASIVVVAGLTFFPALALGPDRRAARHLGGHRPMISTPTVVTGRDPAGPRPRRRRRCSTRRSSGARSATAFVKLDPRDLAAQPGHVRGRGRQRR